MPTESVTYMLQLENALALFDLPRLKILVIIIILCFIQWSDKMCIIQSVPCDYTIVSIQCIAHCGSSPISERCCANAFTLLFNLSTRFHLIKYVHCLLNLSIIMHVTICLVTRV